MLSHREGCSEYLETQPATIRKVFWALKPDKRMTSVLILK